MAKEKKRLVDEKEKSVTMFYYEIIGSIIIILTITTLGKLGRVGDILTTLFKVLFGDWFWAVLLLILFIGFYYLFVHEKFEFKNTRFIGITFLLFTILVISHFSVHKYIESLDQSYISATIDVYKVFINTGRVSSLGGGVIGAFLFYLSFYLLGNIGVIILSIILTILSLSLFFNKPLIDILKSFVKGGKKIKDKILSFNKFFKYEVGSSKKININTKTISLKQLRYFDNDINQRKKEDEINQIDEIIKESFDKNNIKINDTKINMSYYCTTYYYTIGFLNNQILNEIIKEIKSKISNFLLYFYDNNELVFQFTNQNLTYLSLKELFQKLPVNDNFTLPIGIDYENKIIDIDLNMEPLILLIGEYYSGIKTFIQSFIISCLIKENFSFYRFIVMDSNRELEFLEKISYYSVDLGTFFEELNRIINERLNLISSNNMISYIDYFKKENKEYILNKAIVIININDINSEYSNIKLFENKMLYYSQLAKKAGLTIIYIVRHEKNINSTIYNLFDNKIWFKNTDNIIDKIKVNKQDFIVNSKYLLNGGDTLFINKKKKKRMITSSHNLTLEEINGILANIIN